VKLSEGYYIMDPVKAVEMVDENTICVAAILGSTLTGEFEDVKKLNYLLVEKNKETGYICFLIHSLLNYLFFL
jgi:glutamate decarboxylase